MSKLSKILIFFGSIGVILVIISFVLGTKIEDFEAMMTDSASYTHMEQEYELTSDTFDLKIDTWSNEVKIVKADTTKVNISYYKHEKDDVTESYLNGKITFSISRKWYNVIYYFAPISEYREMVVTIPNDKEIGNLNVDVSSGGLKFDGINVTNSINVKSSSGNIEIKNVNTPTISVKVSSGNYKLINATATSVVLSAKSGNLFVDNVDASSLHLEANSGNISLSNLNVEDLYVKLSSGITKINDSYVSVANIFSNSGLVTINDTTIKTVNEMKLSSGNVTMNDVDIEKLNLRVSSARIEINFRTNVSHYRINVDQSSGNLKINNNSYDSDYNNGISNVDYYIVIKTSSGNVRLKWPS